MTTIKLILILLSRMVELKTEFTNTIYAINKLRPEFEKAKTMINWAELSRTLAGDRSAITKDRIPQKHSETINELINSIANWLQKTQTGL